MTTEDFIREFELLADAPNGVKILREMVLQLAVQGKLVEQDPGDEPTIHLLEDVDSERKRLADKGLIKKSKKLKAISEEEHPYLLPSGWEWVRLRQITNDCGQKVPDDDFTYIDVGSIDKERGVISKDVQILTPADAPSRARKLVMPNTVIYSTVRPYLLNIAVIDRDFTPSPIVSTAFFVLHPLAGISSRFIYHYLRSQIFIDYVNDAMTAMAYPAVNDSKMSVGLMPLPPLAEQKRIVAKVDELMRLCDELEEQQTKKNQTRVTLNASCLHALTSPSSNSYLLVSISGSSSSLRPGGSLWCHNWRLAYQGRVS
ncbi:MAG: restriction endonuclease subunit S [Kiritimatiellae bacterium]|nr:restriction endonuclease subunit S [Kiritimatiellia bacterium]